MKRVGIISLYGNKNYGNKLQSYATQEFFRELGFDTIVIKNCDMYQDIEELSCLQSIFIKFKNMIKHCFLLPTKKYAKKGTRQEQFIDFSNKYITETHDYVDRYNYKKKIPDCDYYVVGSDQVWNYHFAPLGNPLFYLEFAPNHKRFSISASFGFSDYDKKYENALIEKINGMRFITVRENTAKEIIERITDKKAHVILDPTLLVAKEKWEKIEKDPKISQEEYVLTYFLGTVSATRKESIKIFAKERGLQYIPLNDINYGEYYTLGPDAFLYLIHNAKYVITDSFHACAFSIIYEKKFIVMKREGAIENMSDRMLTLLKKFGISDKYTDDINMLDTDYQFSSEILHAEKSVAENLFLNEFFGTKE